MLLAFSTASDGVRKVSTDRTGPKISSRAIRCAWDTPVKTVGGNQKPRSGRSHGGDQRWAPSASPMSDSVADPGQLLGRVDGADVGVLVQRVAEAQRAEPTLEGVEDLLRHGLLDEQPGPGAADVSLVEEDAADDALDGLVDGGVVEDDVGRLAAELEGELLAAARERAADQLADVGGAGERDLVDAGVLDERLAGAAGAGHDVDHARREVGLLADLGEQQRGQRRRLGRLEDDGVAGGQGRRDLPGEHEQREVPGDDLGGDAERSRGRTVARVRQLVGPARVVEEVRSRQRDVDVARLLDRLAVVEGLEHRELAAALLQDAGDPEEVLAAVAPAEPRPRAVVRLARRRDRRGRRRAGRPR